MWNRLGSPTCTNHVESAHSHLNAEASNCRLYENRLKIIFDYIRDRIETFRHRRNLKDAINKLKRIATSQGITNMQECQCKANQFKSELYQVDFPCVHNVMSFQMPDDFPPLKQSRIDHFIRVETNLDQRYKEWELPVNEFLPYFQISQEDITISNAYGRPDPTFIQEIISMQPQVSSVSSITMINYITMLFLHYSGEFYGYYEYHSPFCDFVTGWLQKRYSFEKYREIHPLLKGKVIPLEERNDNLKNAEMMVENNDITTEKEFVSISSQQSKTAQPDGQSIDSEEMPLQANQADECPLPSSDDEEVIEEQYSSDIKRRALELSSELQMKFSEMSQGKVDGENCVEYLSQVFSNIKGMEGKLHDLFKDLKE